MQGDDRVVDAPGGQELEERGVPRHHEQPAGTAAQGAGTLQERGGRTQHDTERTLYVGNLHPFVTDSILRDVFETCGGVEEVKIVRCKVTNLSAGYGFVQFTDAKHAERALGNLHGRLLYGQELRLNWTFSRQQEDTSSHVQIFVGDLANDVNHRVLYDAFSARCTNCSYVWVDLGGDRVPSVGIVGQEGDEICAFVHTWYTAQHAQGCSGHVGSQLGAIQGLWVCLVSHQRGRCSSH